jgi:uncharacterized membrane protein YbhN (UPF0104 family)
VARLRRIHLSRRSWIALQLAAVALVLGFLGWAFRDTWRDARPRIADASPLHLGLAFLTIGVYYLLFVVGWQRILAAYGIVVPYRVALQAEMASMLAKYVPGGVWTPAARVLWLRRAGVRETPVVLGSVLLEAGLSAVAGVLVFLVGMVWVGSVGATTLLPLLLFTLVVLALLHPRPFAWISRIVLRPFGDARIPPLPYRTMVWLVGYYAGTWLVGGVAVFFLLRAVGGAPELLSIPYLGGTAAVGAIVAVLAILAPSGIGVREASMVGLLLAVVGSGVALGAMVLNRLAITVVEAVLLLAGLLAWRAAPAADVPPPAAEAPAP